MNVGESMCTLGGCSVHEYIGGCSVHQRGYHDAFGGLT